MSLSHLIQSSGLLETSFPNWISLESGLFHILRTSLTQSVQLFSRMWEPALERMDENPREALQIGFWYASILDIAQGKSRAVLEKLYLILPAYENHQYSYHHPYEDYLVKIVRLWQQQDRIMLVTVFLALYKRGDFHKAARSGVNVSFFQHLYDKIVSLNTPTKAEGVIKDFLLGIMAKYLIYFQGRVPGNLLSAVEMNSQALLMKVYDQIQSNQTDLISLDAVKFELAEAELVLSANHTEAKSLLRDSFPDPSPTLKRPKIRKPSFIEKRTSPVRVDFKSLSSSMDMERQDTRFTQWLNYARLQVEQDLNQRSLG